MLWIFIIIFIMNILCSSHIDVYVYMFMKNIYIKWVKKNIQNEIWAKIFFSDLHVYMAEGYE